MILSKNIPMNADTFLKRCTADVLQGRYAPGPDDYLEYLMMETERRYPSLMTYLRVPDRNAGEQRHSADADHIIPRSVWSTLMFGFVTPLNNGNSYNVLSNLFWRAPDWNRQIDRQSIDIIRTEARSMRLNTAAGQEWRRKWIEIFLRTKHDEGLLFAGEVVDPFQFDRMESAGKHSNWLNRG
jgi:hypothetical protein